MCIASADVQLSTLHTAYTNIATALLLSICMACRGAITCTGVSRDGLMLVTASMDASVKVWEIASGIEVANLYVGSAATCCALNHNSEKVC